MAAVAAAALLLSTGAATASAATNSTTEPTGACATNLWTFSKQNIDPRDYKKDSDLRAAILKAVDYDATKVGSAIVYDFWNARIKEAVNCGFTAETVIDADKKPGLNAIVPCGMLDKALANEGIKTSEYTHGELSKKLRTINDSDSPLLRLAGIEYFDDIADRALECGLVTKDRPFSGAGSSKFFDTSSASTELMSSMSSRR